MKKELLLSIALAFCAGPAWSGETVQIKVKGMVCSFCAQGVEKKLKARPEVEKVKVRLGDKRVDLTFKDGKSIEDKELKKIINDAGYDVTGVERGEKAK